APLRQAVYGALGTAGRAQLHARVGAAIEENDRVGSAAALAQHFTQAVALVGAAKAIEYTTKAGHEAAADLAFEDAVGYFERAVDLLEQHAPTDQTRRAQLLTQLPHPLIPLHPTPPLHAPLPP